MGYTSLFFVWFSPVTTIIKCHHRKPTFNCEMQKKHLAVRLRPDPMGELTAFPQTPELDLKGPTSKGGEGKREWGKGESKGREGGGRERDLAPQKKKILAPPLSINVVNSLSSNQAWEIWVLANIWGSEALRSLPRTAPGWNVKFEHFQSKICLHDIDSENHIRLETKSIPVAYNQSSPRINAENSVSLCGPSPGGHITLRVTITSVCLTRAHH